MAPKQNPRDAQLRLYSEEHVLSLKRFYDSVKHECGLRPCAHPFPDVIVGSERLHRPALAFAGFTKRFPRECIQVTGEAELAYLKSLSPVKRRTAFDAVLSARVPAIVFADGVRPDDAMLGQAKKKRVALFTTRLGADVFCDIARKYLQEFFAPRTSVHGTLVDVQGIGMLYVGKSGVGKSECALDLLCKGHVLISDDVVNIVRRGTILVGECNEILGHHMEIRGIGIVNIKKLCGLRSVRPRKRIDVQVELVEWNKSDYFDRTGLDEKTTAILGVAVPHIRIPVSPGKNISAISEILAMHLLSRREGKSTIMEFDKKLISHMKTRASGLGRGR
jgi:HPr kinase/phosphorylase